MGNNTTYRSDIFYFDLSLMLGISVTAIVGNILVFICYWKIRSLRSVTNVFILSLSISDLFVAILSTPASIAVLLFGILPPFDTRSLEIIIYLIFDMGPSILSIYSLTLVALDRALAITKPFIHEKYVTRKTAWVAVVLSWFFVCLMVMMVRFMKKSEFSLFIILMSYGIPVSIMVFCYSLMAYIAKKHASKLRALNKTANRFREEKRSTNENNNLSPTKNGEDSGVPLMVVYDNKRRKSGGWINGRLKGSLRSISSTVTIKSRSKSIASGVRYLRREFKAALTLSFILSCFVLSWTPFMSLNIMLFICGNDEACGKKISPELAKYFKILHYSNSALNPILYVLLNKRWRSAFKKILCCCERKRSPKRALETTQSEYFGW